MSNAYEKFSSYYPASTNIHSYFNFYNTYNEDFQNYFESLDGNYKNMNVDYFLGFYVKSKDALADIVLRNA